MRTLIFSLAIAGVLAVPISTLADSINTTPSILISEVAWAGSSRSDADEWLELANLTDAPIDLTGWHIDGAAGSSPLAIPSGTIPAHGTFIISNYDHGNAKSVLDIASQFVTTSVSLPNSSLNLVLRDAGGTQIDSAVGNKLGTTGAIRASMERTGLDADAWQTATATIGMIATGNDFGTPGVSAIDIATATPPPPPVASVVPTPNPDIPAAEPGPSGGDSGSPIESGMTAEPEPASLSPAITSTPQLSSTPTPINPPINPPGYGEHDIIITEFSSRGDEWVEYRNETENPITLDGFTIEDASGHATRLTGVLTAHSYAVTRTSSGTLNNDGDAVRLRDGTGQLLDELVYGSDDGKAPAPTDGTSSARTRVTADSNSDFALTTTPTPGEINIITAPVQKTSAKIASDSLVASPDAFPPVPPKPPADVAIKTAAAKIAATKLTFTGPSTLYAEQSGLFVATLAGTGSGDANLMWLLDDAPVGTGREVQFTADVGTHLVHVEADLDGNVIASAEHSLKVRAIGGTIDSSTPPKPAKKPSTISASKPRSASAGSGVGVSLGVSGTVIADERIMGTRKFLLADGTTVYLSKGKLPVIAADDVVRVIGKRSKDGKTLNVTAAGNITVTGHETASAQTISASDADETFQNKLVTVSGIVGYPKGKRFSISGDSDISVYWKIGESLPAGLVQQGAETSVTGVLMLMTNQWTLVPRSADDITTLKQAPPRAAAQTFDPKSLAGIGTNIAIALATLFATLGTRQLVVHYLHKRKQENEMEYEIETEIG